MATLRQTAAPSFNLRHFVLIGGTMVGLGAAIVLGLLAGEVPLLVAAGLVVLLLALVSLRYPELATVSFIMILFTNTAVILVRFHGVPYIAGTFPPLLLFIPVSRYVVFQRQKVIFTSITFWVTFYLLVQILGALGSGDIQKTFVQLYSFVLEGFLIYFLLVNAIRTPKVLNLAILAVLLSSIVLGAIPAYQQFTKTFDNNYFGYGQVDGRGFSTQQTLIGKEIQPRLAGALGEKNRFSQIMLMMTLICLSQVGRSRPFWWRVLAIIATLAAAIATVLPFSRGTAVGFGLLLIVGVMLRVIPPWQLVLILVLSMVMLVAFPQYSSRLVSIQEIASDSASGSTNQVRSDAATLGRLTEMKAALVLYAKHPILGVGPNMYKYYSTEISRDLGLKRLVGTRESHSLYLDIAANTGTLGLVAMMSIFLLSLRQLLYTRKRWRHENPQLSAIATGLSLAFIAFLTTGIFLHLTYIRYFWTFMGLVGATIQIGRDLEKQAASNNDGAITVSLAK